MKAKRFLIYVDCINIILLYLIVIAAYTLFFEPSMKAKVSLFEYLAVGGLLVYFYFVRDYIESLVFYLIANCLAVAAMFLAPDFHSKLRLVAFAIGCFIINVYYWMNDRASSAMDIHFGMVAELVGVGAISAYLGYDILTVRVFYFAVAFVFLQCLKTLFDNTYELLISGQVTEDMPVQEMFRNNYFFAGIIMAICIFLMLFVRADGLIQLLRSVAFYVGKGIMFLAGKVLNFFASFLEVDSGEMLELESSVGEVEEVGVLGQLWEIVSALLILAIVVLVLFYVVKGIRSFFKEYRRRDRKKHSTMVFKTENEVRERLERDDKSRGTGSFFRRTNNEKIRYIYKKKMLSYIKKGNAIKGTNTPVENAGVLLNCGGPDIGKMTALYEKTRYSGREATAADVSAMKESARGV